MPPGGLAAVCGAPLGVDVKAVGAGGEASDGAADSQGGQVGPLFQLQATAYSISCNIFDLLKIFTKS